MDYGRQYKQPHTVVCFGDKMPIRTHNAEVEGSSPSLTTIINELRLLKRGIFAGRA
jgi:hypothetical protein